MNRSIQILLTIIILSGSHLTAQSLFTWGKDSTITIEKWKKEYLKNDSLIQNQFKIMNKSIKIMLRSLKESREMIKRDIKILEE